MDAVQRLARLEQRISELAAAKDIDAAHINVLLSPAQQRDFAGQRDLASQAPEPKLTWHLQKAPGCWLLLSEHFGFVEHITQPQVTASMVEEFIFYVVRNRAFGEEAESMVGLTPDYVSWAVTQKLPAKLAKKVKGWRR
jgi:hypothetical protein